MGLQYLCSCILLQLLARQAQTRSFVRRGATKGYAEVTISGGSGRDYTVRRGISAENDSSTWTINGEARVSTTCKGFQRCLRVPSFGTHEENWACRAIFRCTHSYCDFRLWGCTKKPWMRLAFMLQLCSCFLGLYMFKLFFMK